MNVNSDYYYYIPSSGPKVLRAGEGLEKGSNVTPSVKPSLWGLVGIISQWVLREGCVGKHVLHPCAITVWPCAPQGPHWGRPRVTHLQPHLSRQGARLHVADEDARFLDGAAGNAVGDSEDQVSLCSSVLAHFQWPAPMPVCPGHAWAQYPSPLSSTCSASFPCGNYQQKATSNSPYPTSHPTYCICCFFSLSSIFLCIPQLSNVISSTRF